MWSGAAALRVWPCAQARQALPLWGLWVRAINPMALSPMSTLKSKAFQTKLWQTWGASVVGEWAAWRKVPHLLCPGSYTLACVTALWIRGCWCFPKTRCRRSKRSGEEQGAWWAAERQWAEGQDLRLGAGVRTDLGSYRQQKAVKEGFALLLGVEFIATEALIELWMQGKPKENYIGHCLKSPFMPSFLTLLSSFCWFLKMICSGIRSNETWTLVL